MVEVEEFDAVIVDRLRTLLPGISVIKGQANRVPAPVDVTFVVFTVARLVRLSTSVTDLAELERLGILGTHTPYALTYRLDFQRKNAFSSAMSVAIAFRSPLGAELFKDTPLAPLYTDDPKQLPFIDGSNQYQDRYILEATFQVNLALSTKQAYADMVAVDIMGVPS